MKQTPDKYQKPSTVFLPQGEWVTVLDCLCDRFVHIDRDIWVSRFERGLVLGQSDQPLHVDEPYRRGMKIIYFRENPFEEHIPGEEKIIYQDEHLLVVDKPPFLPVIPTGKYVTQTLLARLIGVTGNQDLQPLHRIDRHTCGLVMFSCKKESRGLYQRLFRDGNIRKSYRAVAPALLSLEFPYHYRSRIVRGEPFFLSQEIPGAANAHTVINVLEKKEKAWLYHLEPVSGKKHQLRVHMASLGAPIVNDFFYPIINDDEMDNYEKPLQLLAYDLSFTDPVTRETKYFCSELSLVLP